MNSTVLKLIALFFMFLDHIHQFVGGSPIWLTWLGRLSAPLFFFTMAWGLHYTHDRKKYLINMYLWGVGMAIGDFIANSLIKNEVSPPVNDIFVTLLLVGLVVTIVEKYHSGENKTGRLLLISLLVIQMVSIPLVFWSMGTGNITIMVLISAIFPNLMFCEGGIIWVLLGVGIYFSKRSPKALSIVYTLFSVFFLVSMPNSFAYETMFITNPQWMMIGALPFMLVYNGKKGSGLKWVFYVFYPAHIFLLCWIGSFFSF